MAPSSIDHRDTSAARREAARIIRQLLAEMHGIVRDYHPLLGRPAQDIDGLIGGTAFFPGGCGLWRGPRNHGEMPELFPDGCIMLVGHNYDSVAGHMRAAIAGGEVERPFWRDRLLPMLAFAGISPERCFFTNALMGLQPGSAVGRFPRVPGYEIQCREYLARQIEIVQPAAVIALGRDASVRLRRVLPDAPAITHPSAREFSALATRSERLGAVGRRLAAIADRVGVIPGNRAP